MVLVSPFFVIPVWYIQPMQVIYIDSFFVINLAVNYLLISATAKLSALRTRHLKFFLAALVGAAYAAVTVLPFTPAFVSALPVRLAFGVLLALIAFGRERNLGRLVIIFFALSACFAGASLLVGRVSFKTVLLTAATAYAVITCVFKFAAARKPAPTSPTTMLRITLGGNQATVIVLNDTGNSLRDPQTGTILPVLNYSAVRSLFKGNTRQILESALTSPEKFSALPGDLKWRLIPYNAVGVSNGLLLAVKAEEITGAASHWFAISPNEINSYGGVI
jgi:stage II sporulation protein GA (sporulation sigma-E factor processing peptidase)